MKTLFAAILIAACTVAGAQTPAKESLANTAAQEAAAQAVKASGILKNMKGGMSRGIPQMIETMAVQVAKDKNQDPEVVRREMQARAPQMEAMMNKSFDIMQPAMEAAMNELSKDPEVIGGYKRMFMERFSEEELTQLIAWYRSPLSGKLIDETVNAMEALTSANIRIMNKHIGAVMPKVTAMQQEMLKTIADEAASKKK